MLAYLNGLERRQKYLLWLIVWALTRLLIVAQVGYWNHTSPVELQDVNVFEAWSNFIVHNHQLPIENTWQYPPGAAYVMLLPRIGGGDFGISFIVEMLAFDLLGLGLLAWLGRRRGSDLGVWTWLLAMPLLFVLPVLRFDMVPTVIAIAALIALHRRPAWFGALAGIGASVKVWPVLVLFGEWDRRRLVRSVVAAAVAVAAVFLVSQLVFGDETGFLKNQNDRGLQVEAIAATPWQLREAVTGTPVPTAQRYGTNEVASDLADAVGKVLDVAAILTLLAAAWWWWRRDRAIRAGRRDLADEDLARDFVFTLVLLFIVTSRVLSPQYLVWMVGLGAVVLCATRTRMTRPALVVIGSIVITAGIFSSRADLVIRNVGLVVAVLDACWILVAALREPPGVEAQAAESPPASSPA